MACNSFQFRSNLIHPHQSTSKLSTFAWHTIDQWLWFPQSSIAKACHLWTVDRYYSVNRCNTDSKDETGFGRWRRLFFSSRSEEFGLQSVPLSAHVAGVSACRLDMRICELLLLRMESCVPPFTPLLASDGCLCFISTAKYRFTVQLRHFRLISDCTFGEKLQRVIKLIWSYRRRSADLFPCGSWTCLNFKYSWLIIYT